MPDRLARYDGHLDLVKISLLRLFDVCTGRPAISSAQPPFTDGYVERAGRSGHLTPGISFGIDTIVLRRRSKATFISSTADRSPVRAIRARWAMF